MAYRQFCALTFAALGWIAVACGGSTGTNAAPDATEEQPPGNPDQAPSDSDQASNTDRPPTSSDQPPSDTDPAGPGGGGRLTALCEKICSTISTLANECGDGMATVGMGNVCSDDIKCEIPPDLPCVNELADAFDCVFVNLAAICSSADDNNPESPGFEPCQAVGSAYTTCARANGLIEEDGNNGNGNGNGNNPPACSQDGGCDCTNDCSECTCEAGTNSTALSACLEGACAMP